MRRLPRLRSPAPPGFITPSSTPSSSFRGPAAATIVSPCSGHSNTTTTTTVLPTQPTQTRYLSTTPVRRQPAPQADALPEEDYAELSVEPKPSTLAYPQSFTTAAPPSQIDDPSYKPAETAEGLEEVGGLADWWDQPAHWSHALVPTTFGRAPADKVTDPFLLQVLARRAVVEALVAVRHGRADRKRLDRIFGRVPATRKLDKIVTKPLVAGEGGEVTLADKKDWVRVWDSLCGLEEMGRREQQKEVTRAWLEEQRKKRSVEVEEGAEGVEVAGSGAQAEATTPASALKPPKTEASISPEKAEELVRSFGKGWLKAELRDPVVKFYAAKRIQQLTGHRITDAKLHTITTIGSLIQQLTEPPKPKKLAELVQSKEVFKGLSNVRVFPRRVTPIDKEKMAGRWKVIVRELEKRELPVIGTGDYGAPIEKKWIEGKV
ncbi:Large ribosomal subunit protein mL50 [Madurella fahalii]|uniref:Large ribosomal subunit protein mL50 n=1 Tax=Madurella fahalii TaxID=1157608 RepID=A0ABQ0GEP3_9PEZI